MAHSIEAWDGTAPHCAVCAAQLRSDDGVLGRTRRLVVGWLARINGTPVADIARGDLGSIRRLAEA